MDGGTANIEVILVRMEGKIDRFGDRMTRFEQDVHDVRQRLHSQANEVQIIMATNIPAFKQSQETCNAKVDERIKTLETEMQQRKGALNAIKILYGVGGVTATGAVAVLIRLLSTGGVH